MSKQELMAECPTGLAHLIHNDPKSVLGALAKALMEISKTTRLLLESHQCLISWVPNWDFEESVHSVSLSTRYEAYKDYNVRPTGEGMWALPKETRKIVRLKRGEIFNHPRFKNFSDMDDARGQSHPPLTGWLAAPIIGTNGAFLGIVQVSDKDEGDYTDDDEKKIDGISRHISITFSVLYAMIKWI